MTTQTITDTTPRGAASRSGAHQPQSCDGCKWLTCNAAEAADGVGWCQLYRQCRAAHIERTCIEFRNRTTKGD